MANKLENLDMTSVDFVKRGANQDADIKLYKSADGVNDNVQVVMKSNEEIEEMIQKSENAISLYAEALVKSITSALNDTSMNSDEAQAFMEKSLSEFDEAVKSDIISDFNYTSTAMPAVTKNANESEVNEMANLEMMNIDKSALSPDETEQLNALLAKCANVTKSNPDKKISIEDDDLDDIPPEDAEKGAKDMKKSALHPTVQAALDRMESLAKSIEMGQFTEIAKKYEILGEDPEKLAKTLYDMKQQSDDVYKQYISVLDKSVDIMNKSGMFGEIGKSAYVSAGTGVNTGIQKSAAESKIETIAKGIMDKDPTMSYTSAVAKAWEDHPELAVEYENSRR